jgi:hypothetical protein
MAKARRLRMGPFSSSFQTLSRSSQFFLKSTVTLWRIPVTAGRVWVTAGRVWLTAGKVWVMPEKARRLRMGPFFRREVAPLSPPSVGRSVCPHITSKTSYVAIASRRGGGREKLVTSLFLGA